MRGNNVGENEMSQADERTFQDKMIEALVGNGWLLGDSKKYDRERALQTEDLLGFVRCQLRAYMSWRQLFLWACIYRRNKIPSSCPILGTICLTEKCGVLPFIRVFVIYEIVRFLYRVLYVFWGLLDSCLTERRKGKRYFKEDVIIELSPGGTDFQSAKEFGNE